MRNAPNLRAEKFRTDGPPQTNYGFFVIPQQGGPDLRCQVAQGIGWDHVSVSTRLRTPTWEEMCRVKDLFFRDDEVAVQYHPAKADYVNIHPHCLQLFRPQTADETTAVIRDFQASGEPLPKFRYDQPHALPLPPAFLVGPKMSDAERAAFVEAVKSADDDAAKAAVEELRRKADSAADVRAVSNVFNEFGRLLEEDDCA